MRYCSYKFVIPISVNVIFTLPFDFHWLVDPACCTHRHSCIHGRMSDCVLLGRMKSADDNVRYFEVNTVFNKSSTPPR